MDEIWERAVETALDGQTDHVAVRNLTLDGAVKCIHGRLPHPTVFERFPNLLHLSLANIGVSSLEQFPRLVNLQKLVLSDNRIAGGLECLVEAGLRSLIDLDLSNNRIQSIEDLSPLAELRLVSLDMYECPVTRVNDYRTRVFGLIKSLKYLDKMDAEENETLESDEKEEEEQEDDDEEDDRGSGEVDGGDRPLRTENGHGGVAADHILDGDEDDESEEENEIVANGQYVHHESNGFRMARAEDVRDDENDEEIEEEEEDNSSGEEIDEEDAEDDVVVEVHEVPDSDYEDDGVEDDDGDEEDDDEEEVDNEEQGVSLASGTGRFASIEGEIDGHEQGEDDADEDDNGETGEEDEQGLEEERRYDEEEDEDDDEENGSGYLVQPVNQHAMVNEEDDELSDMEPVNVAEDEEEVIYDEEDVDDDLDNSHQVQQVELPPSSSSLHSKRKISDEEEDDEDSGEENDMGHRAKVPKNDP